MGEVRYQVLAISPEGVAATAESINNRGEVVGYTLSGNDSSAYHWSKATQAVYFPPTSGYSFTTATNFNDHGDVVVTSSNSDIYNDRQILYYSPGAAPIDVTSQFVTYPYHLTNNGSACSYQYIWDSTNGDRRMGNIEPYGSNDANVVVGYGRYIDDDRAVIWSESTGVVFIEDLTDMVKDFSYANDINNHGRVVGECTNADRYSVAYYWDSDTDTHIRTMFAGNVFSRAYCVNDAGTVCGEFDRSGSYGAFVWNESEGPLDLNNLIDPASGWELSQAFSINDAGQIVGYGYLDGQQRGFLLTPVPEPAGLSMLALAVGAALVRRRVRVLS